MKTLSAVLMSGSFETYISSHATLTEEELRLIMSYAVERKLRRKQLILQEGEISRHKIFVSNGLLKHYRIKDDGSEHVMRFVPENTWTSDYESFLKQTPSIYTIEALEDSALVLWTMESIDALLTRIPAFKAYIDKLISTTLQASYNRILMNISYTSEEKYDDFVVSFPDLLNRVPLHLVASYLGMSRETLTRIRQVRMKQAK